MRACLALEPTSSVGEAGLPRGRLRPPATLGGSSDPSCMESPCRGAVPEASVCSYRRREGVMVQKATHSRSATARPALRPPKLCEHSRPAWCQQPIPRKRPLVALTWSAKETVRRPSWGGAWGAWDCRRSEGPLPGLSAPSSARCASGGLAASAQRGAAAQAPHVQPTCTACGACGSPACTT
jgi:hypothetical protein